MGTIAKGEITLSPVNDAYTVSITPASCTIKADFDGSNPQLDNAKGTITIKRGTRDVPFHVVAPHISTGGSVAFANQTSSIVAFEVTSLPNNVLNGTVGFDIKTDDGFDYQTTVQFAFTIVRESTMLDWIKDWEGSKTKVGGTYIMTPKMFVGKKEDIVDSSVTPPIWKEGALTGIYIGPDILSSQETSAGIYGYLKDNEIFHINADGDSSEDGHSMKLVFSLPMALLIYLLRGLYLQRTPIQQLNIGEYMLMVMLHLLTAM